MAQSANGGLRGRHRLTGMCNMQQWYSDARLFSEYYTNYKK